MLRLSPQKFSENQMSLQITRIKHIDRAKLYRLFNFVYHLVTLPPNLDGLYRNFITQPKIQEKMQAERSFLKTHEAFFGKALKEEHEEGREQGIEQIIMDIHNKMGFNAEQIANMTTYKTEYIQAVLDKYKNDNAQK